MDVNNENTGFEESAVGRNALKKLNANPHIKRIGGFDIETRGKTNEFLMGSIVHDVSNHGGLHDNKENIEVFHDKNEMIERMTSKSFSRGFLWFATNLQFDLLGMFKKTKYLGNLKFIMRDSRMISAKYVNKEHDKYKRSGIKFYDTLNHAKISVKQMGELLNFPKYEKPNFLGQYPIDKEEWKILEDYNIRDSQITRRFAMFLQDNYNRIGCNLKCTLPSSSMDLYRRKYMNNTIYQPKLAYIKYMMMGYYGGRTEAIKRGRIEDCYLYDINSLYPTAMSIYEFPNPNKCYYKKYESNDLFQIMNYEGVANIEMIAPDTNLPYLPVRYNNKLVFPQGIIKGHYTFFEIREALKMGYELIKIYDCIYYPEKHKPFKDFVHDNYSNRLKCKIDKSPIELVYKILLNSLYGKFAQKINSEPEILHESALTGNEFMNLWQNPNIELQIINDYLYIKKKEPGKIAEYINPIYSIYVTAYARHILYKSLPSDVYYMDTDSCITKEKISTGTMLGEWKQEADIEEGIIVKPKMYYYNDKVKVKGCGRMNVQEFKHLLKTNQYSFNRITKFKESVRRNIEFNTNLEVTKNLSLEDNKRQWEKAFNENEMQESTPLILTNTDYK